MATAEFEKITASEQTGGAVMLMLQFRVKLINAAYGGAHAILRIVHGILWPIPCHKRPKAVCIYRIGNIGDIVCALPAMYAIRRAYPDSRVVLLTSPGRVGMAGAREILHGADWLDEIITYTSGDIATPRGKWQLLRRIRRYKFDFWFELPNDQATVRATLRNMLFAKASGVKRSEGWRLNTIGLWRQLQSDQLNFPNEVERLLRIVKSEDISVEPVKYGLAHSPDIENKVTSLLQETGYPNGKTLVAIAPGAKRTTNFWLQERWIEAGRAIAHHDVFMICVGGSADAQLCEAIAEGIGYGVVSVAGKTGIPELAELLGRCNLVLAVDSGVQHVAAAVGTPCVSLISARDYRGKWHPYGKHAVIEKRIGCHTCLIETCPYNNQCMRDIAVEEVVSNALAILKMGGNSKCLSTASQ